MGPFSLFYWNKDFELSSSKVVGDLEEGQKSIALIILDRLLHFTAENDTAK